MCWISVYWERCCSTLRTVGSILGVEWIFSAVNVLVFACSRYEMFSLAASKARSNAASSYEMFSGSDCGDNDGIG